MSNVAAVFKRIKRGFTLIELLVVLMIAALLLQGLTQVTGNMIRHWSRSAVAMENLNAAIAGMDALGTEIAQMKVLTTPGPGGSPVALFSGEANQLSMVRPAIGFENRHDLDRVTYKLEAGDGTVSLIRLSSHLFSGDTARNRSALTRTEVAEIRGTMTLQYSGNLTDFSDSWLGAVSYPVAVRITAELEQPAGTRFERTVIIGSEVDATCARRGSLALCRNLLQSRM